MVFRHRFAHLPLYDFDNTQVKYMADAVIDSYVFSSIQGTLDEFSADLRDVLILHLACVFFVNDHYMMSSGYVDALDCGMRPEPGSEYWVAPFIQEVFDQTVAKHRPDIAAVIRSHTSMRL